MKQHSFMAFTSSVILSFQSGAGMRSFSEGRSHFWSSVLLVALLSFPAVLAQSEDGVLDRAKTDLMCVCGCPHQLGQCGDECGVAPKLIGEIQALVNEGAGQEEVYSEFEARYGAMVYASPKAEGFNLIGWLLPFVGLMFGGLLVWGVARKLKGGVEVQSSKPADGEIEEKYRKMLQKELSE